MNFETPTTRRGLFHSVLGMAGAATVAGAARAAGGSEGRRSVIVMLDGFGLDYLEQSDMPTLKRWARDGLFGKVRGLMPAVTNVNNASICCGVPPSAHGITGNSFLNARTSGVLRSLQRRLVHEVSAMLSRCE